MHEVKWHLPDGLHEAYITLLAGSATLLPNIKALAASLVDVGSTRPLIVMVDQSMATDSARVRASLRRLRSCLNVSVVYVQRIANPFSSASNVRWAHTYTKLNAFGAPLRRAVYLDADTLVLRNVDRPLFEPSEDTSAVHAVLDPGECGRDITFHARSPRFNVRQHLLNCVRRLTLRPATFNSGVMAFAPSQRLSSEMLAQIDTLPSYDGGDQGFLNTYFNRSFARLDQSLNVFATDMAQMRRLVGHLVPPKFLGPTDGLSSVSILHFAGMQKPQRRRPMGSTWMTGAWEAFSKALQSYDRRCGRRTVS